MTKTKSIEKEKGNLVRVDTVVNKTDEVFMDKTGIVEAIIDKAARSDTRLIAVNLFGVEGLAYFWDHELMFLAEVAEIDGGELDMGTALQHGVDAMANEIITEAIDHLQEDHKLARSTRIKGKDRTVTEALSELLSDHMDIIR